MGWTAQGADETALVNLGLEAALLGSLMDGDAGLRAWQDVHYLRPDDFAEPLHARLFEKISGYLRAGEAVSLDILKAYMANDPTLNELGGGKFLGEVLGNREIHQSVKSRGQTLRKMSTSRAMIKAAAVMAEQVADLNADQRAILTEYISSMQQLLDGGGGRQTMFTLADLGKAVMDRLNRPGPDADVIPTGIVDLDRAIGGGLRRAEFTVLAGRPSMGKSAIAQEAAYNIALCGGGVFIASLEMNGASVAERMASRRLWDITEANAIPYERIHSKQISSTERRWVESAFQEMASFPLIIDEEPGLTPVEIEARARRAKAKMDLMGKSLDVVIVDHLHKVRVPGFSNDPVQSLSEISATLAEMAKRLHVSVVALAQLNRGVEGREEKRPALSDLRGSGAIEQDADLVLMAFREDYYLDRLKFTDAAKEMQREARARQVRGSIEISIDKNRAGPIGVVNLRHALQHNVVFSLPEADSVAYNGRSAA